MTANFSPRVLLFMLSMPYVSVCLIKCAIGCPIRLSGSQRACFKLPSKNFAGPMARCPVPFCCAHHRPWMILFLGARGWSVLCWPSAEWSAFGPGRLHFQAIGQSACPFWRGGGADGRKG
ncbi:hypothetical protein BC940DRAFT_307173, partial [Gongronella butleri]